MFIQRLIIPSTTHSFFLFGARGTGKSTPLDHLFPAEKRLKFDLLDSELEEKLARRPNELADIVHGLPEKLFKIFLIRDE